MKVTKGRPRHGLNAAMARVKLRGFRAIDRRTVAARETLAFRSDLIAALGGADRLSPQRRRFVDLASRANLLLDHVDAWLLEQQSLVNRRSRSLLPVLIQRQAIADHLIRILDKLGLDRVPQPLPTLAEVLRPGDASAGAARSSERPSAVPSRQLPPRSTVTTVTTVTGTVGHESEGDGCDDAAEMSPQ